MAIDLNQSWLTSNCLVSFWNFTKHLYLLKKEFSLFQPLRDIYIMIHSKSIRPYLLVFKLHYAYIRALFLQSQVNSKFSSSSNTPSQNPLSRSDQVKTRFLNCTTTTTTTTVHGDKFGMESEELLKEADEVCKICFSLIPLIDSNIVYFRKLVGIWIRILEQLNQPIYLQFILEYFRLSKEIHLFKAIIFIKALLTSKCELLPPEIHLTSAFDCLTSCENPSIIILELWVNMSQLYLTEENFDMVFSCIRHGKTIGRFLLSTNPRADNIQKINFFLSQMECILVSIWSHSEILVNPIELLQQILLSFRYAKASSIFNLVLYVLATLINFCKEFPCSPKILLLLTQEGVNIISFFSENVKLEVLKFLIEDCRDIMIEVYNIFLDAYALQYLWQEGLHFLELAQSQIPTYKHALLMRYNILFKSKMNIDVKMDIIRVNEDLNNTTKSKHWLMGAHAAVSNYDRMYCYKAAIDSLCGMHTSILRIYVMLEFIGWLVLIKVPRALLLNILEGVLVDLVDSIIWRFNNILQDDNYIHDPINSKCESSTFTIQLLFEKFEEWAINEIDCLLQLSIMVLLLCGRLNHYLYTAHLQVTLFCVFSMLSTTALQDVGSKVLNQDQAKKGKGSVKPKSISGITELPKDFIQWSKYSPTFGLSLPSTTEANFTVRALSYPNITLYFLNYFSKELKNSIFSHFQLFPLLLINAISSLYKNCSTGWSRLSHVDMLDYFKRFKMECPYEFWRSKMDNEGFVIEDRSHLDEVIESIDWMFTSEQNNSVCTSFSDNSFTFLTSDFIIYLALEISQSLVLLGSIQGTIDILYICEAYMKYYTKPIFHYTLNFLKFSILHPFFDCSDTKDMYSVMLQDQYLPIDMLINISRIVHESLDYSLTNDFLERYILFSICLDDNSNTVFAYKNRSFEFELVTRQLDFHFSCFSSSESSKKRCIIDIDILLNSFYRYFCTFLSSQNLFNSLYAMKKCAHYMNEILKIARDTLPFEIIYEHYFKVLSFYNKLIELYINTMHCISSFSMQFGIEVNQNNFLYEDILDCRLSLSSFGIDIFERLCMMWNKTTSKLQLSSPIEKMLDKYALHGEQSFSLVNDFFKMGIYNVYESIANLVTLQTIPFMSVIEFLLSKAMFSLYHFHGTDIVKERYCSSYFCDPILFLYDHTYNDDYEDHQISKSKSLYFLASGNKYIHKLSLVSLNCGTNQELLKNLSYIQLSTIGVFDSKITAHYLALYQSILFSLHFQLRISNVIDHLVHSKESLSVNVDGAFCLHSCFTRLKILPNFFNIINEMQASFRYLILQHSSDRKALYYSYIQQPPCKPKISKCAPQLSDLIPLVGCCKVNPFQFDDIRFLSKAFSEHQTSSSFEILSATVQAYFDLALCNIKPLILQEINHQELILFVLCDDDILSLPIELFMKNEPLDLFGMVTRDFSLQLLNFRYTSSQSFLSQDNIEEKSKEILPPLHDESKYDIFDFSNTQYFLSPYDCSSCLSPTITDCYDIILKRTFMLNPKVTSKWAGVSALSNYQNSFEKWQIFKGCNILLLLSESLMTQYPLNEVFSSSLCKDRNLIMIFDKLCSHNLNCFTVSHPNEYYFAEIAGFMSIIGGNVFLTNFWPINRELIVQKLPIFLNCLLKMGKTIYGAVVAMDENPLTLERQSHNIDQLEFSHHTKYFISYGLGYLRSI